MNPATALLGLLEVGLLFFPIWLALFGFWIWMLIHAIQNKHLTDAERIVWVLVVVLLNLLGAVLYFLLGRPPASLRS